MGHSIAKNDDGTIKRDINGRANSVAWDGVYFYGAADGRDPKGAAKGN